MKPSIDSSKQTTSILFSQRGSDATSAYFFRHPDPSLPGSKNQYAIALFDSYNPDILYGETLLIPQWTQTTLSQEEIRQNGGVPPPPQPILPAEFRITLYNPDHQVVVRATPGSWNSAPYWEFEMPQESFRKPTNSILDRTQGDPVASELTPKINFRWKKEGKLSKDYVCVLAGKSTNPDGSKRKNREPDITVALFKHQRELTIYEPNLSRVEMEDHKGLEIVLLLGIAVIKDVFQSSSSLKEVFNIPDVPKLNSNENPLRRISTTTKGVEVPKQTTNPSVAHRQANARTETIPPSSTRRLENKTSQPLRPSIDPLVQWEIDAETARLKKLVEREAKEQRHAELAEAKRVQKLLEAEKKERRRKAAEVDKETERLKKIYGPEQGGSKYMMPSIPERQGRPQQSSAPPLQTPFPRPQSFTPRTSPQNRHSRSQPFLSVASGGLVSGGSSPKPDEKKLKGKKSFFGLRSVSDDDPKKLKKKPSILWS